MMPWILLVGSVAVSSGQTVPASVQNTVESISIHGVILNANTDQPLARALVQAEGHSVLTGHDGRFEFTGLLGMTTVSVRKPGFYRGGVDFNESATKYVAVGSPGDVEIRLYPEALLTGSMTAPDGEALAQVQVLALRLINNEPGSPWMIAGQAITSAEGQFRLPLPGGEYVIETQYMPERPGSHGVVLPVMVPAATLSGSVSARGLQAATMRLTSGSEQRLDLHPLVSPSHMVSIHVDSSASGPGGQFSPQIQVHLANGLAFFPLIRGSEKPGDEVVNLPNGSYLLSAVTGIQDDGTSYGETRVTVAGEDVNGVMINQQRALELPVEVSLDPAAIATGILRSAKGTATATDPSTVSLAQQLGMFLQRTNAGVNLMTGNVSPVQRPGGGVGLTLLPGSYRLRTSGYSSWFIESATVGGTDLLTQDLIVDGGSSTGPLRLVVSNQTATVKGTINRRGQLGMCYVYLIATTPSASSVITTRSGTDGGFSQGQIPPGSYMVVASETPLYANLTDPAVQRQLATYVKTVTVGPEGTASADLDAVIGSEFQP